MLRGTYLAEYLLDFPSVFSSDLRMGGGKIMLPSVIRVFSRTTDVEFGHSFTGWCHRTHWDLQPQLTLEFTYEVEGLEWGHVVDVCGLELLLEG